MQHYPRNPTVTIPIDVALFADLVPMSGEAANLSTVIRCLDNGASVGTATMVAAAGQPGIYTASVSPASWTRGHFRATTTHASGQVFASDFSVGLAVDRSLGYSAVYQSGGVLALSLWVTENGDVQFDYARLEDVNLLDGAGQVVAAVGDVDGIDGVFRVSTPVALASNALFLLDALAVVDGPAGRPPFKFPLRLGVARP